MRAFGADVAITKVSEERRVRFSVLKKKPKDGPLLYDVIYKTYMSRSIPENIFDLLYNLHMSRRRYYELRKKAIRLISLRLWSAPNQEINMWLDVLTMLDKNPD